MRQPIKRAEAQPIEKRGKYECARAKTETTPRVEYTDEYVTLLYNVGRGLLHKI